MLVIQGGNMLTPRTNNHQGFTLIEMAITLAILGFLLAAAMPSIGVWMDNTRIRNVADSIQSGMQAARSEAVRRNKSVSFWLVQLSDPNTLGNDCTLSNTSASWVISGSSPAGQCAEAPSITAAPQLVMGRPAGESGSRVSVTAMQSNGSAATTVTFNGYGQLVNNTDSIQQVDITGIDGGSEYRFLRLVVSREGMVRMCDPRVPTTTDDPRKCPTPITPS